MTRDRLVGWWRFHSPRQLRRMLAIAVRAEAERDAARAEADDLRRQLLNETYRPEGGEIVMRELGKVKRERDAARAEAERLRERTHEIADEANRRYAPYVSRCAEFDNQIAAAREHFSRYAFPEPFSGVPRTWWEMTSQYNRLALMEIIGQRDAAVAEAARVREALTGMTETLERITTERNAFRDERNEAREALQAASRELRSLSGRYTIAEENALRVVSLLYADTYRIAGALDAALDGSE